MKKLATLGIACMAFTILVLSACKQEPPVEPPTKNCDYKGRFVKVEGTNSYYSNYLIDIGDGGAMLLPCKVVNNTINPDEIFDGMPITLSYEVMNGEEASCGNEKRNLEFGCVPFRQVTITCIAKQPFMRCGTVYYNTN